MTRDDLMLFEAEIAAEFNAGRIPYPVHLAGGNEDQLTDIFKQIRSQDWIFCQWRSHYHCLLKGVPREELRAAILAGRSIALCFSAHRVFSSAIAGGHLPIALGVAWEAKREGRDERVYVFYGDMVARMGIYSECNHYAFGFNLPITFIQEDNGKSVCTDTDAVWGSEQNVGAKVKCGYYRYDLLWPHSGAGQRINF